MAREPHGVGERDSADVRNSEPQRARFDKTLKPKSEPDPVFNIFDADLKAPGYTCAGCAHYAPSLQAIQDHDDTVHGGARCTFLPGRWIPRGR